MDSFFSDTYGALILSLFLHIYVSYFQMRYETLITFFCDDKEVVTKLAILHKSNTIYDETFKKLLNMRYR